MINRQVECQKNSFYYAFKHFILLQGVSGHMTMDTFMYDQSSAMQDCKHARRNKRYISKEQMKNVKECTHYSYTPVERGGGQETLPDMGDSITM